MNMFNHEDGDCMFFQNTGNHLPECTVLQSHRAQNGSSPPLNIKTFARTFCGFSRLEVLTAVLRKILGFWNVMPSKGRCLWTFRGISHGFNFIITLFLIVIKDTGQKICKLYDALKTDT
jgi:hypothetical protein